MTRRELYQRVSALSEQQRDSRDLLARCQARMRLLRDLPYRDQPVADDSLDDVLIQDDALGQIYQAINAPALESAYRSARRDRRKFTEAQIPAVTQLFTPRWVVEFLLHNTLGKLWLEMHPDSQVELPWLVDENRAGDRARKLRTPGIPTFLRMLECPGPDRVRDIRVLDPACGTMNFGLVAIELLKAMYREELDHAGRPGWPAEPSVRSVDQISHAIVRHNIAGIDIDPLALRLAAATLEMKLRVPLRPDQLNLHGGDSLFDTQIEHRFAGACDVVVTNPPYLSARNLPRALVERMKREYPASWRDAGACFIERCMQFARDGGQAGILAMQSFMFTGSFERLRRNLNQTAAIEAIVHVGGGLFDIGNPGTLQTAAVIMRKEPEAEARRSQIISAFRLIDEDDKRGALAAKHHMHRITQDQMLRSPRMAWNYWLDDDHRRIFAVLPLLSKVAPPRQGLATTDNARFVRFWWEVEPTGPDAPARATPNKWFAYTKSGRFRRWYEAPRYRVDWHDDGRAIKQSIIARYPYLNGKWSWVAKNSSFYGRGGGVTYSYLTSGRFSARRLEEGSIFDVAGSALFPEDPLTMLAVLNSSTARSLLAAINPTVNFQVGDLAQLPVPPQGSDELREMVSRAIERRRRLDCFDQTTPDFVMPLAWGCAGEIWRTLHRQLVKLESQIDHLVAGLYGSSATIESPPMQVPALDQTALAVQWVSFALRRLLARGFVRVRPVDKKVARDLRDIMAGILSDLPEVVESTIGPIEQFLAQQFFRRHVRAYQRRPVLWQFSHRDRAFLIAHDRADRAAMTQIFQELHADLPDGWDRFIDDGIAVNLAPLGDFADDPALKTRLRAIADDLKLGRYQWSGTRKCVEAMRKPMVTRAPKRESASARHPPPLAGARRRHARPACT